MPQIVVELRDVWKIFGTRAAEAMKAIRSENLSKKGIQDRFGCVVGVQSASFTVNESEIVCIMGLSGSGKSTLVRHINGLLEPTAGEVLVDGEDITRKDATQLRLLRAEKIGMVFQNIALMPHRTILDNVSLPLDVKKLSRKAKRETASHALSLVELSGWENHYPHELSGGMQQRVGLARALAANPKILLMDEPFSALDPLIRRQLQDEFIRLSKITKKTTVFITHDLDEAIRIGDRIAIMKDGALIQIGTPEEIVTRPGNDYVAKFVAGTSRLKLVTAQNVMLPLNHSHKALNGTLSSAPRAAGTVTLSQLINIAVDHDGPIVVTDTAGASVGIVDRESLLRAIQGTWEETRG